MTRSVAAVLVLGVAACARAADPVAAELSRLEARAAAIDPAKLHEQMRAAIASAKSAIAAARSANDPALRLYRLRDAYIATETLHYTAEHHADSASVEKFEALWNREKPRFAGTLPAHPDALRSGLIEAAGNRADRLSAASLPYGRVTSPVNGVYYLAEATANQGFAAFVAALPASGQEERRPSLKTLTAAANDLETETIEFFAADPTNRAAIPVSAKLKEARELIAASAIDGATLTLLEARLALARHKAVTDTRVPAAAAGGSIANLYQQLVRSSP